MENTEVSVFLFIYLLTPFAGSLRHLHAAGVTDTVKVWLLCFLKWPTGSAEGKRKRAWVWTASNRTCRERIGSSGSADYKDWERAEVHQREGRNDRGLWHSFKNSDTCDKCYFKTFSLCVKEKLSEAQEKIERFRQQMQWDQQAMEAFLMESAQKEEDTMAMVKNSQQNRQKVKVYREIKNVWGWITSKLNGFVLNNRR